MIKVFEFIKKNYQYIMFILIILLIVLLVQTNNALRRERAERQYQEQQNQQNLLVLKDSIVGDFSKKLKAYEYTKDNYVVQKLGELYAYNKTLATELKKVKGDVIAALKTDAKTDLGGITTLNNLTMIDSNYYGLNFNNFYKDPGFEQRLAGSSKFYILPDEKNMKWTIIPDSTVFDINTSNIKVTYGFKEEKGVYKVFAISQSPKVTFDDLTGGYIINNQPTPSPTKIKRWGLGPYFGAGLGTTFNGSAPQFGWSVGVSINYDLFQF